MPLRVGDKAVLVVAAAAGAAMTPGTISGDAGRMLVTFLGLVSASILPSVTLLVNSMTANGRSVAEIQRLEKELQAAMDALFLMFGCVAVAIMSLLALSIQPPDLLTRLPYWTASEPLNRAGQALVAAAGALVVWRAGQIPAILRRSLAVRTEIAIDEARRKVGDKAPDVPAVRQAFPTHADFGKVVNLKDVQGRDG